MREIEFRGKTKNSGRWAYGDIIIQKYNSRQGIHIYEKNNKLESGYQFVRIDKKTLGQYTGLKDKNGTKIFEGDIVKYTRTNMYAPTTSFHNKTLTSLHKIYWSDENYRFCEEHYTLPDKKCIGCGGICFDDARADENIIEVVGNIYDNKDLLEGEN